MKVLFIFGTRPEAIKLAPLINYFKNQKNTDIKVCNTEQHKEMSNMILDLFDIKTDYSLDIMSNNQTLYSLTTKLLSKLEDVIKIESPDLVIVQGDTTSAFVGSLAAFYSQIKVAHIEAGLRTYNKYSPFPEEVNRELISKIAHFHFVPTLTNQKNLEKENISTKNIHEVGNSVIDSLLFIKNKIDNDDKLCKELSLKIKESGYNTTNRKFILVTGHRRENFGESFKNIFSAIKEIAMKNKDIDIVYPVHLNPNVKDIANEMLKDIDNIYLIKPLEYDRFIYLMMNSYIIITDSGGIQEEAPSLKIPTFVTRDTTERIEVLNNNSIKLVGTKKEKILEEINKILNCSKSYDNYKKLITNPYGNGDTSKKIFEILEKSL